MAHTSRTHLLPSGRLVGRLALREGRSANTASMSPNLGAHVVGHVWQATAPLRVVTVHGTATHIRRAMCRKWVQMSPSAPLPPD